MLKLKHFSAYIDPSDLTLSLINVQVYYITELNVNETCDER